jgi:prepilin-type N-terminal cleavage/methylation domain-containing protein
MKRTTKPSEGFTLIETLVALAIFAFAITGLIAITAGGISNTNFVKNKFTASYLALEGAELVHNLRDTTTITSPDWNAVLGLLSNCTSANGTDKACYMDAWSGNTPFMCPSPDACPDLTFEKSTGRFSYHPIDNSNYFSSIFVRSLFVQPISNDEVRVTSKVSWLQGTVPHTVSYSYDLLNWTIP